MVLLILIVITLFSVTALNAEIVRNYQGAYG